MQTSTGTTSSITVLSTPPFCMDRIECRAFNSIDDASYTTERIIFVSGMVYALNTLTLVITNGRCWSAREPNQDCREQHSALG